MLAEHAAAAARLTRAALADGRQWDLCQVRRPESYRPHSTPGQAAFTTFVLCQFNTLNACAEQRTGFTRHLATNCWLWASLTAVVLLQVLVVQLPALHSLFDTAALTLGQGAACVAATSAVLCFEEVAKTAPRQTSSTPDSATNALTGEAPSAWRWWWEIRRVRCRAAFRLR